MRTPDLPSSFTTATAVDLGLSPKRLRRLIALGEVTRVRRGLYVVSSPQPGEDRDRVYRELVHSTLDAVTQAGGEVMASHLSAVGVQELPMPLRRLRTVEVTRLGLTDRGWRTPGLWVHHSDSVAVSPILVDGVPCTPHDRTVADCLRMYPPRVSVPIADAALHRSLATSYDVADRLAEHRHWHGKVKNAARAVALVDGRRESWLESYAAVCFAEWGIEAPVPQLVVRDGFGRFVARVDAGWPEDNTVLELDGLAKYAMAQLDGRSDPGLAWEAEKARHDLLGNLGLERVRLTLADLRGDPVRVRRLVEDRRRTGRRGRFTGSWQVAEPLTIRPHRRPDQR